MRAEVQDWSPAEATFVHVDLAAMFALFGALLILAGWAAAKGRLKRNYVVGMRTPTIMRTHETWRVAHQRCAWSLWSSGLVMVATGAALTSLRPSEEWALALMVAMLVYLAAVVLIGFAQADKAARGLPVRTR